VEKITDEFIINLYNQGLSNKEIAQKTGYSRKTIGIKLKLHGIVRRTTLSLKDEQSIINLYNLGLNNKEIAEKTGYNKDTIAQKLKANGIVRRRAKQDINLSKEKMYQWYYEDELSFKKIAELVGNGYTKSQIRNRFIKFGLQPRPAHKRRKRGLQISKEEFIECYYTQGMTHKEIASKFDVSLYYVKKYMQELKFKKEHR